MGKIAFIGLIAAIAIGALSVVAVAQTPVGGQTQDQPRSTIEPLPLSHVFTYFFVMLGPLKALAPFARLTAAAEESLRRQIAVRGTAIALVTVLVAASLGRQILASWNVSVSALLLAGGIVLYLVALRTVMRIYEPAAPAAAQPAPSLAMAASPVAFPLLVTPFGIAAVIILTSLVADWGRALELVGLLLVVMVLNLLGLLYARQILKALAPALQVLGVVVSVLQLALGLQMMIWALSSLGLFAQR